VAYSSSTLFNYVRPRGRLRRIASFHERDDDERLLSGSYLTIVISVMMMSVAARTIYSNRNFIVISLLIVPTINFLNKLNYYGVGDIANWEVAMNNDCPSR